MKKIKAVTILIFCSTAVLTSTAQDDSLTKTRFVIGLSAPELLHAGLSVDLTRFNQFGVSAGIGPTWGGVWPSLSAEHRLYFRRIRDLTTRTKWFFRQSLSYFPGGADVVGTLSIGLDITSKKVNKGWTIDAGLLTLFSNDKNENRRVFPALRIQYYNYLKKQVR